MVVYDFRIWFDKNKLQIYFNFPLRLLLLFLKNFINYLNSYINYIFYI